SSGPRIRPRHETAVAVRHHAMERAWITVEQQRQEVAVAFPERQLADPVDVHPRQLSLDVAAERIAAMARDQEQEAEPVLALLAEPRPTDRAAELHSIALDPGLLADLAPHPRCHVLVGLELATEPVVLAQVLVVGAGIAV